mmetsp:Transcript_5398/g.13700  ORF Transcript_5398/g.13700 Transcript_5398/m.13700 type:complete len:333 (+) Transcript_5398:64-1062(+)|eukprot:CAMPEP_0183431642 /NCGR_PEP_ID=MMETSP0370-20130417/54953_1 /TAXON_ID=268820 /ORGANISM="Peridinium aciculiferum, Strain PAER-2" /LENGTH=332 /DNA_ID=CAMNT_0025617377 /DNA_START=60 /DNA_END=1058 /DNA_ORIENTATION=+
MAVGLDSHAMKDMSHWTPADVRGFLESILPGHPCVDNFTYTSGYVLDHLEKEDVRRQAKDEEAANIIWAELKGWRGRTAAAATERRVRHPLAGGGAGLESTLNHAAQDRDLPSPAQAMTVYVKTNREVALELEVQLTDTVATVKELVAAREGTQREVQRLVSNGISMQDDRTLESYGLHHGAHLLLVPQLRDQGRSAAPRTFAPRGLMMVPGSRAWHPRAAEHRPFLPVLCSDVARSFPISLAFDSAADAEAFAAAAQREGEGAPVLELQPSRPGQAPIETRLAYDPDTGAVRLENSGDVLLPSSEYVAFIHYGGRGGHTRVMLQTGAAATF